MADSDNGHPTSSDVLCMEMLKVLASHCKQLFTGIDGLDECQEAEGRQILLTIDEILRTSKTRRNIRIFLTSRELKYIKSSLHSASRIDIGLYALQTDIAEYIRIRIRDLSKKFSISPEDTREIINGILSKSYGLWITV